MKLGELLSILDQSKTVDLREQEYNDIFAYELMEARPSSPVFKHYKERDILKVGIGCDDKLLIVLAS